MVNTDPSIPAHVRNYWNSHPNSVWLYAGSFPAAIAVSIIYFIPFIILSYQTLFKYRSFYFIVVFIGALLEVAGYGLRAASLKNWTSVAPYATSQTLIILAPLLVGAGDYLLISRLCLRVLPSPSTSSIELSSRRSKKRAQPTIQHKIFFIPVQKLTLIFVLCDIFTLLVQASGSSIAASSGWKGDQVIVGERILIGGLALQLLTFSFFLIIVGRFHTLTRHGVNTTAGTGWKQVLLAVYISSAMIVIRCVYRLIEFALGIFGYPFTHEWTFYVFEALPMLVAIGVFCLWHPGAYFGAGGRRGGKSLSVEDEESSRR